MISRELLAAVLSLLLCAICASTPSRAAPIPQSDNETLRAQASPDHGGARRYYIEFRVAEAGLYGHSYVAYGRLNARGEAADVKYADLHPDGYLALLVGHLLPVPANAEWDDTLLS